MRPPLPQQRQECDARWAAYTSGQRERSENTDELGSRITSVLEILEHEGRAIAALEDPRAKEVLGAMSRLRAEIVAVLTTLPGAKRNGRRSAR